MTNIIKLDVLESYLQTGENFVPGFYDIPDSVYHGEPLKNFMSAHGLIQILRSPAHYKIFRDHRNEKSEPIRFGGAAHRYIFTGDQATPVEFGSAAHKFLFQNGLGLATVPLKGYESEAFSKAEQEIIERHGTDCLIVTERDMKKIITMAALLKRHPLAKSALVNGVPELSGVFIRTDFEGILTKVKTDYLLEDIRVIVEYKTAVDARVEKFQRQVIDLGYDIQCGYYVDAMKQLTGKDWRFLFIVQEKDPPFAVNFFMATPELIELGMKKVRKGLEIFWKIMNSDKDFDKMYDDKIIELYPPTWALNQI